LQRHLEASGKTRKGVAADAEGGSRGGCWWDGSDCAGTLTKAYRWQNDRDGLQQDDAVAALRASAGSSGFHEMNHPVIAQPVAFTPGNLARGAGASPNAEVFPTLKCSEGRGADDQRPCVAFQQNQLGEVRCNTVAGTVNTNSNASGRNTPMVAIGGTAQSVAFPIDTQNMTEGHSSGGLGFGQSGDPSFTVTKGHSHAVAHAAVAFDWQSGGDSRGLDPKDTAQLQRCQTPAVAFTRCDNGQDAAVDHTPTMRCGSNYSAHLAVAHTMTVRRLTPVECERLQGFPDNWTAIPWRKKTAEECPDGPRYKALGNSMACNCMAWIGERIAAYEQRGRVDPTPAGTAGIAPAGELNHEGDRHG
jgi:DNA (cytosine-5)-methyltransferase 1